MLPVVRITRRFGAVALMSATLAGATIAATSPASAIGPSFTERRGGCSFTCEWRVVSGTCKTAFNIKVPCPLRQKRCAKDFCTQVSH